jgi:hypothetical protein
VGDRLSLAEMARDHPAWEDIAWSELARSYASFADYKQAGQMVLKHLSVPTLPTPASPQVEEVLAARFRLGQTNEHEGLVLAITQDANGRPAEALATLQTLLARPRPSPAVFFLESQWRIRNNEWQNAWGALSHFVPNR